MSSLKSNETQGTFKRNLQDHLCVQHDFLQCSSQAHMFPIKQSDLHDVSVCMRVFGGGGACMAGKSVLLSRCEEKGGK